MHVWETLEQRITEPALTTHPQTGHPIRRLIQPMVIAFKGSGFYVTDSHNGSSKANAPASESKSQSEIKTPATSAKSNSPLLKPSLSFAQIHRL